MNQIMFKYNDINEIYYPLNCFDVMPNKYKINRCGNILTINNEQVYINYNNDYYFTNLYTIYGKPKPFLIHRLVAATFCVNLYDYSIVNHIDGEKHNNQFDNLEWCTLSYNMQHAIELGLHKVRGEDNGNSILTNEQVHLICKYMESNVQYSEILRLLNLPVIDKYLDILTKIKTKHIWSHISDLYNIPQPNFRSKQIVYSNEQIHEVCKMLSSSKSSREIGNYLNIDFSNKNESDKFYKFLSRIRNKESYLDISKEYIW